MAIVYAHYRKTDNEIFYIGIGKSEKRPYSTKQRNFLWDRVVNKHGFTVEILIEDCTSEQAAEFEIYLISFYGRRDLKEGPLVNLTDGGQGHLNVSKEAKDKIHSKEAHTKAAAKRKVPILQYDKEGNLLKEWPSATDIKNALGVDNRNIISCCTGKCKATIGFVWRYKDPKKWFSPEYINNNLNGTAGKNRAAAVRASEKFKLGRQKIKIPVVQLDMEGNFIKNWDSAVDAQRAEGFNATQISRCCKGKSAFCKNFK